ncbi:hypothetical protein NIES2135_18600 [Leptolyngbya boryana NIES-2135]|jgi:hypothetical protein|uniref:DUF3352 domain-containing protein n=1 Tax=Leptolyngbya boryana NIES-2135 TaxID=1973484 RepID=A0A1Z4JE46_LEPBY|nr:MULTISPECIES: DUF3352 domain-containing protein [Leptolyngbya]BAY55039.1 hypothetical protein NIES2135_18600 [Leptolyngbya boryana NIES-2135]MBD2366019.1 DUF3352 domain-containing protein [Leptolyngbya sp. FACHB-161]MBD2372199.1 DUF3352 domain-containing protein [Leptolyngbya sp. FACHB-238]MBD2396622.1 DUF3352 domain-containing protein [Leptolyngbya sp. FACHB-239]MBD2403145.1 DUF3352 domain-containing protein [Leptolyngbya sp. FACHB-402]
MLLKRSALSTLAVLSLASFSDLSVRPAQAVTAPTPVVAPLTQPTRISLSTILPSETLGVVLVNTQDDRWQELSQFQLFPDGFAFPGSLLYPTEKDASFEKDIKPWLGEQFGVAFLSAKSIVTISDVKDPAALAQYVDRVKKSRKKAPKEAQYKGVTILEFEAEKIPIQAEPKATVKKPQPDAPDPDSEDSSFVPTQPKFAIAVLPNHFVSSTSTEAIQELLDAQGKLSENPKFQKFQQNPKALKSIVTLYGEYGKFLKAFTQLNQQQIEELTKKNPNLPVPPVLDPSLLDPLAKFYDTAEGFVWAESTGLRAQFAVNLTQSVPENLLTPLTTRNQILSRLPEVNYMMSNSQNLALYWQALTLGLESQPSWKKNLEQSRKWMQDFIGVDDRDIFPWMNGEYAIFAYPTRQGFIPSISPGLDIAFGMMVQTDDRAAAEAGLKKFQEFVTPRLGQALVHQSTLAGQPVTSFGSIEKGRSLNFLSHGWTDEQTLVMLFGGGSMSEFSPTPTRTLPQSANFRSAIAPFPDANLGYFYVNQGAFMSFLNTAAFPMIFGASRSSNPFATQLQDSLSSIRSISGASSIKDNQVQFEGFLSLASRLNR